MRLNKVFLEGNLGGDCKVEGKSVRFTLFQSKSKKKEDGTWGNIPHMFNCFIYTGGDQNKIDNCIKHLKKGAHVVISGSLSGFMPRVEDQSENFKYAVSVYVDSFNTIPYVDSKNYNVEMPEDEDGEE